MLTNYLKIAVRNLLRHRFYSLINILGLAVGLACCILILLYVQYELSYDTYHARADQIYRLEWSDRMGQAGPLAPALMEEMPEVVDAVRFRNYWPLLTYGDRQFYQGVSLTDPSIFRIFSFPLLRGDPETALRDPYSMVVSEEVARKFFGEEDPLGKLLLWDNEFPYTVTGVLRDLPENSHFRIDVLASLTTMATGAEFASHSIESWSRKHFSTYLLLGKDYPYTNETFGRKVVGVYERHAKDAIAEKEGAPFLQPLTDIHRKRFIPELPFQHGFLDERFDQLYLAEQRLGRVFGIFSALAIFVTCLGLFALASFTAEQRTKEIGIRKALGASEANIVLLLSREFTWLVVVANVVAWPVAYFGMQGWLENFAYRIDLGWESFVLGGLLALGIAWLTVSYQAVKAALANPVEALRYE